MVFHVDFSDSYRGFSLSGFKYEDLRPGLTQEGYDEMKAAWKKTTASQQDNWPDDRW